MTFEELFVGSGLSYGEYLASRPGPARTISDRQLTPEVYRAHLAGEMGLGLVPIRPDGTCRFGAIDIDLDTIDHETLYQQVTNLRLPLYVCRSKSGGAHLYVFLDEPGMAASRLRQHLEQWAARLGYAQNPETGKDTELFPKQTKVGANNLGNWINLPYFDAAKTTRWCMGPAGPLTLDAFLEAARPWDGVNPVQDATASPGPPNAQEGVFKILSQGPPCIEAGVKEGVPQGARNSFMFNLAIGARRARPDDWKELVREINQERCTPPLERAEVESIIKSVGAKASYEFQCTEGAISGLCNFQLCLRRPYGKGYKREKDPDNFDQLKLTNLRKINTDPPRYILEVNGQDIELDSEQFLGYTQFKRRLMEKLDVVAPATRQDRWELQVQELLRTKQDIDAPEDASRAGLLLERIRDYLVRYRHSRAVEDLLKDLPFRVTDDSQDRVLFRATGLFKYLSQYKLDSDPQRVYALLHGLDGAHSTKRIKGRAIAVWWVPYVQVNEQTEDFTPVELNLEDEQL